MIAASAGRLEVVKLLLNRQADVNAINQNRQSSLHYAASKSHFDVKS